MAKLDFDLNDNSDIIKTIQNSVPTQVLDIRPDQYVDSDVKFAPQRPLAKSIVIASLTGLATYANADLDDSAEKRFIQVVSPVLVELHAALATREDRRYTPAIAAADPPTPFLDGYIPREDAMIILQTRFVQTDSRDRLLAQLGNIVADEELLQEDDGVTQTIKTQAGIRRSDSQIVNPVPLRPFRTFPEVAQPESPFIVRLKKEHNGIYVGIFEADGGAWKNTARLAIQRFLLAEIDNALIEILA